MVIKITSIHKNESNLPVQNLHVGISEFYLNTNTHAVNLRTNIYTVDEEGNEYPVKLMHNDPVLSCVSQDRDMNDWANSPEYYEQAKILFKLIFDKIAQNNAENPNGITYELLGFPEPAE